MERWVFSWEGAEPGLTICCTSWALQHQLVELPGSGGNMGKVLMVFSTMIVVVSKSVILEALNSVMWSKRSLMGSLSPWGRRTSTGEDVWPVI